jgi:hypothetical protein
MAEYIYTEQQTSVIEAPLPGSIFISGPAGSGKTSAAIGRLERLLAQVPGHQILVLVPQRSLGLPYEKFLRENHAYRGSLPSIITLGGLARRLTGLFWPLAGKAAGFHAPHLPPYFLSLETAQYVMSRVVDPKLEQGYFNSVTIDKNRIYSQIIDNLNKAAVVRFPLTGIAQRLKSDQNLDPSMLPALDQTQQCALEFRQYCLEHNLLDYSLQMQTFLDHVWPLPLCQDYFHTYFPNLIYDNLEEDVPAAHDLLRAWLPRSQSALLVMDESGGYRTFLGADPISAQSLSALCQQQVQFNQQEEPAQPVQALNRALGACIRHEPAPPDNPDFSPALTLTDYRFYPEMLSGVVARIRELLDTGTASAGDIVVLAPYLSDALKFSLAQLLQEQGIASRSARPSRMYLEEPAVKAVLTFAKLAHPAWEMSVSHFELRDALMLALPDLDIIRADLIAQTLYSPHARADGLKSFDALTNPRMQERISFAFGKKLEELRAWLVNYAQADPLPLDIFISRLFGERLSQKGFGLFADFDAAERIAQLIASIQSFRQFLSAAYDMDQVSAGLEFIRTVEAGLLPAAFMTRREIPEDAVLIAPAHSFLMENRPVTVQFWLDVGSLGWWERLNQPLTNPYILRREWQPGTAWTYSQDFEANQEHMQRVVAGLLNRCRQQIIVCSVQVNERGSEQRGPLLQAFQTLRKRSFSAREDARV